MNCILPSLARDAISILDLLMSITGQRVKGKRKAKVSKRKRDHSDHFLSPIFLHLCRLDTRYGLHPIDGAAEGHCRFASHGNTKSLLLRTLLFSDGG